MSEPDSPGDAGSINHDVMTLLTSIVINAEHLQGLAQGAAAVRDAIARAAIDPETARGLLQMIDELAPISSDLLCAASQMRRLLEASK